MKRQSIILVSFATVMSSAFLTFAPAQALDVFQKACNTSGAGNAGGGTGGNASICGASQSDTLPNIMKNVIDLLLVVLGMIAVIMIVIGGIRYTTSNGDQNAIKSAKDTILYSVIGLIIAILAFPIVNFVINAFSGGSGG